MDAIESLFAGHAGFRKIDPVNAVIAPLPLVIPRGVFKNGTVVGLVVSENLQDGADLSWFRITDLPPPGTLPGLAFPAFPGTEGEAIAIMRTKSSDQLIAAAETDGISAQPYQHDAYLILTVEQRL